MCPLLHPLLCLHMCPPRRLRLFLLRRLLGCPVLCRLPCLQRHLLLCRPLCLPPRPLASPLPSPVASPPIVPRPFLRESPLPTLLRSPLRLRPARPPHSRADSRPLRLPVPRPVTLLASPALSPVANLLDSPRLSRPNRRLLLLQPGTGTPTLPLVRPPQGRQSYPLGCLLVRPPRLPGSRLGRHRDNPVVSLRRHLENLRHNLLGTPAVSLRQFPVAFPRHSPHSRLANRVGNRRCSLPESPQDVLLQIPPGSRPQSPLHSPLESPPASRPASRLLVRLASHPTNLLLSQLVSQRSSPRANLLASPAQFPRQPPPWRRL
jgi:hypothetical protein